MNIFTLRTLNIIKKTYSCIPIKGKEDEWHEIFYGEPEPFKSQNFRTIHKIQPTILLMMKLNM